jgi:hypothetical protein
MTNRRVGHLVRFLLLVVSSLGLAMSIAGQVWAPAIVSGLFVVLLASESVRHLLVLTSREQAPSGLSLRERLLQDMVDASPMKQAIGFVLISGVILLLAVDSGSYAITLFLIPAVLLEVVWVVFRIARRRTM